MSQANPGLLPSQQRTWTLQEYCSSQRLMVVKESAAGNEADEELGEICSALPGEARMVTQLRYEHLVRQPTAMPVWLSDGVESLIATTSKDDAEQIWSTYNTLSERLYCLYPVDSVRA
eukprot:scaffold672965_cov66-Prasinocladus_malaysianus.AAC.1